MRQKKILIVDDDRICRMVVTKQLGGLTDVEKPTSFEDGMQVLEFYKNHANEIESLPDIIFLDIYMPNLDGWGFLAELDKFKSRVAKMPQIVILTSSTRMADQRRAEEHSLVSSYMVKPVKMVEIQKVVKEHSFMKVMKVAV